MSTIIDAFKCDYCSKVFEDEEKCRLHELTRHKKKYLANKLKKESELAELKKDPRHQVTTSIFELIASNFFNNMTNNNPLHGTQLNKKLFYIKNDTQFPEDEGLGQ